MSHSVRFPQRCRMNGIPQRHGSTNRILREGPVLPELADDVVGSPVLLLSL